MEKGIHFLTANEQTGAHLTEEIRNDWKRSRTLVATSSSAAEEAAATRAASIESARSKTTEEPPGGGDGGGNFRTGADEPTLLYGGGRNAPLTLVKATLIKSLEMAGSGDTSGGVGLLPAALASVRQKAPSLYASCYSDDHSSTDEFRSANTSFDDPDPFMGNTILPINLRKRIFPRILQSS